MKDLKQRTKEFTISVFSECQKIIRNTQTDVLTKQLLRSASSVGANTRASFRARSNKEFIAKIGIVIEEADESAFWLEILIDLKYIEQEIGEKLKDEANELVAIFVSLSKKHRTA